MLLTVTQLEQYRRDGFLILPGLFSAAEVQVLKDDLPRLHAEDTPANFREKNGLVRTAMGLHLRSAVYANVVRHPRLVEPAMQILGDDKLYVQQEVTEGAWRRYLAVALRLRHPPPRGRRAEAAGAQPAYLSRRGQRVQRAALVRQGIAPQWAGAGGAGYGDDQLSAVGSGQSDRGGPDPRGRHRFRQRAAGTRSSATAWCMARRPTCRPGRGASFP
jgi:hypothetical protein